MSVFDRLKNVVTGGGTTENSSQESRTLAASTASGKTKSEVGKTNVKRIKKDRLELLYAKDSSIFQGVNLIANQTTAPGIIFEEGSQEARDFIREWSHDKRLLSVLNRATRHILVFGSAYVELVFNKTKDGIVSLVAIDPKSMEVIKDMGTGKPEFTDNGELVGWVQETVYGQKIKFTEEEDGDLHPRIVQFNLYQLTEGSRGLGIVEPLAKASNVKLQLEDAAGEAAFRLGMPLLHAQMGDEAHYPTDNDLHKMSETLKNINNENVVVTPYTVDIDLLQPKELRALSNVLDYFRMLVSGGLGVPSLILYGKGEDVNKATATTLIEQFYRNVLTYQERVAEQAQEIIRRVCKLEGYSEEEIPYLRFKDPKVESLDTFVDNVSELVEKSVITPDRELENYVRERQGLPELKDEMGREEFGNKETCEICGKKFKNEKKKNLHMSIEHKGVERLDE